MIESDVDDLLEAMHRSAKGNLTRKLPDGRNVTVFPNPKSRGYCWCIADGDDPEFSPGSYDTEEDAAEALFQELKD